jgi:hypothetical protein
MHCQQQAPMPKVNGTYFGVGNRAETFCASALSPPGYLLIGKHMDIATLKDQAERCRRLAKHADPFTQKRLLDLALEYDARIAKLEPKPSAALRRLRNGEPYSGS